MYGNCGKILRIDLTAQTFDIQPVGEEVLKSFLGGSGLAAWLYYPYADKNLAAFDPASPLIFAAGPLAGTDAPTSGRFAVGGRSPLTGLWADADSAGMLAVELKQCGFDAVVITGRAAAPVYLAIGDGGVEFRGASGLWGRDTYETPEIIRRELGKDAGIACIGPAGENQVPFAAIMAEGVHARAAGRCGLGAVMGAKNVKAVAAKGTGKVAVHDEAGLMRHLKEVLPELVKKTRQRGKYGTPGGVIGNAAIGDTCAKNWQDGDWVAAAEKVSGEVLAEQYLVRQYFCHKCFIGCGRVVRMPGEEGGHGVGGPEYETIAGFGAQCLMADLGDIIKANDLCNRLGLDTISASSVIAYAMEAADRGLLKDGAGEPPLVWGDSQAVLRLLDDIAYRRGLGARLAQGVRQLAAELGPEGDDFAIHVKGLEFAFHDPRALASVGVAYATNPRGACHRGCSHVLERTAIPELGYDKPLDRLTSEGKGRAAKIMQDYAEVYNCAKACQFLMPFMPPSHLVKWLNFATGWDMDLKELLTCGERVINLKRLIGLKQGLTKEQDKLPRRVVEEAFPTGGARGNLPDLPAMLAEYYQAQGWGPDGRPTAAKLAALGLREE